MNITCDTLMLSRAQSLEIRDVNGKVVGQGSHERPEEVTEVRFSHTVMGLALTFRASCSTTSTSGTCGGRMMTGSW